MPAAPLPPDETERLAALHALDILDSPPDGGLDALVRAATRACGTPIGLVTLVDADRQWFKANIGLQGLSETPRAASFCAHAILSHDLLEVEDTRSDPRFADNPLTLQEPHLRFYAGMPLRLSNGRAIGSLCVIDRTPRRLEPAQRALLHDLAQAAAQLLDGWEGMQRLDRTAGMLRASRAHARRMYEATPALLHTIDPQGVLTAATDLWLDRLGYARVDIIGRPVTDLLLPEDRARYLTETQPRLFRTGSVQDMDYRMLCRDGTVLEVLLSAVVERSAPGGAVRGLTVIEDVTARRRAERALADERLRLNGVIEASGIGTWDWDVQRDTMHVNPHFATMLGYRHEELRGLTRAVEHERVHPDDLLRLRTLLDQHLSGGTERFTAEFRVRHRDGRWVWVLSLGAVVARDAAGAPLRMLGTRKDINERRRHEDALRKSQDLLDRTGRAAGVGGWEIDLRTNEVTWSAETYRIFGVAADTFRPDREGMVELCAEEGRSQLRAALHQGAVHGEPWDLELTFNRLDGSRAWIRMLGEATREGGAVVRLSGAVQDVSRQVTERQALQEANDWVRLATDAGGIGLWFYEPATGQCTWDRRMHQIYGFERRETAVDYQVWASRLHPDDRAATEQAVAAAVAGLSPYDTEYRIVLDDGTVRLLRAVAQVQRDRQGVPLRMVGVNWDVTDIRRLNAELQHQVELQLEASERERALFRNSPDMLTILRIEETAEGRAFRFETVSPASVRVIGLRPEDLIGQRLGTGLPDAAARVLIDACEACIARDTTVPFTLTIDQPSGVREVEGTRTPVRNPATGRITRIVGTMRDVTERKRLQATEHQGQKLEAIGKLAAGVAHDFNNILQSVCGSLEMAQDELPEGSVAAGVVAAGLRAAKRGSYLTHHLLSYARRQRLEPRIIDVTRLLTDLQQLLSRTLGKAITTSVRIDPAPHCVQVDPGQMQTALLNLAINASHAMPKGGELLIASELRQDGDTRWVVFTVADTGIGMDAATRARATEPFYTTKGTAGTGLGLSMVLGFAEQSGGRLSIDSTLGQGTTITLLLPAAVVPDAVALPAPQALPGSAAVLLVDDDADVLVTTGAFLEKAGFTVVRAGGVNEALAAVSAEPPIKAVVTDYAMPGMSGADLITELRQIRPGLPAVLVSGFTDLGGGEPLGGDIVALHKPLPRDALIGALRRLLDQPTPPERLFETLRPRLDE